MEDKIEKLLLTFEYNVKVGLTVVEYELPDNWLRKDEHLGPVFETLFKRFLIISNNISWYLQNYIEINNIHIFGSPNISDVYVTFGQW